MNFGFGFNIQKRKIKVITDWNVSESHQLSGKPLLSITSIIVHFSILSLIKKSELYSETVKICLHKKNMEKSGFLCQEKYFFVGKKSGIFLHILLFNPENSLWSWCKYPNYTWEFATETSQGGYTNFLVYFIFWISLHMDT